MNPRTARPGRSPATLFALGLAFLGYGAGHELVYQLLGIAGALGVNSVHGYMPVGGLAASTATVLGFALAARAYFRQGDLGRSDAPWRRRAVVAAFVPATVFIVGESAELALAPTNYVSPLLLFAVGVPLQVAIGLFVLFVAKLTLRGVGHAARMLRRSLVTELRAAPGLTAVPLASDALRPALFGPPLGGRAPPFPAA